MSEAKILDMVGDDSKQNGLVAAWRPARNLAAATALSVLLAGCSSFSFADLNPFADDKPDATYQEEASNEDFPDIRDIPDLPQEDAQNIQEVRDGLTSARDLAKYSGQTLRAASIDVDAPGAPGQTAQQQVESVAVNNPDPRRAIEETPVTAPAPAVAAAPAPQAEPAPTPAPAPVVAQAPQLQLPATTGRANSFNTFPANQQPGQFQTVVISSGGINGISAARSMYNNALTGSIGGAQPQGQYAPSYNAQHTADLAPVVISSAGVQPVAPQRLVNNGTSLAASGAVQGTPGYFQPVAYQPGASIAIGVERGEPIGRVRFGNGKTGVANKEVAMLQDIAARQRQSGGVLKVVGHASQRTREMSLEDHILTNFNISQKRAEAVADKLIRLGVAPSNIIVEARGANEPVYFEIMPSGEAENRRVEIFLQ